MINVAIHVTPADHARTLRCSAEFTEWCETASSASAHVGWEVTMSEWTVAPDGGRPEGRHCGHLNQAIPGDPPLTTNGCGECLADGGNWVQLRKCLLCGHVGCCDSSGRKHATAHAEATGHALASSVEDGGTWAWCYVDEVFLTRAV
ncbi:UBP-type zinc finger domain-containing protein [Streptomyces wuyuanensis]|uniref:UBP-type zinc finger domain-containing protein n=1 Tax=Streptomyces wuyuanensis TaxID=1196353 RepID=UPI0037F5CE81